MKKNLIKIIKFIKIPLSLSKRQQFVAVTFILTAVLVSTQLISGGIRIDLLMLLVGCTYLLSAFTLRDVLAGWEYVTLLTLPTYFTTAVFLFYYLLPARWLTRLPIIILYGLGMYAILLCENIFNIAAERNIQLLRAAHSIALIITIVTVYLFSEIVLSLHMPFYINSILTFIYVFPLSLQALWSMELNTTFSKDTWVGSLITSFLIVEMVAVFSFWPVQHIQEAVLIATVFYSLVGMTQQYLVERLFSKTIREFTFVFLVIMSIVIITTRWGEGIGIG